jgi:transcriptional regulator
MYLPKAFVETRPEVIDALMSAHPLATIVGMTEQGLEANHVPMLARRTAMGDLILEGHVARANPLWLRGGQEMLLVFQGPQTYVSPAWYASKQEHGKVVPTWNYAVVHAKGSLIAHDDAQWLQSFLQRLTDTHEARVSSAWQVSDAPVDFIQELTRAIVGIEVRVTSLQGKWKTSQNRPALDRAGVKAALTPMDTASADLISSPREN